MSVILGKTMNFPSFFLFQHIISQSETVSKNMRFFKMKLCVTNGLFLPLIILLFKVNIRDLTKCCLMIITLTKFGVLKKPYINILALN